MSGINWPGLLKWSIKHTDGTRPSMHRSLSSEDTEFLRNAIREAMNQEEDPNRLIVESVPKLSSPNIQERLCALGVIEKCLDFPEVGRNLEKLGALKPLTDLLSEPTEQIVLMALEILSFALQNNPTVQSAAVQHGALEKLESLVMAKDCSQQILLKSVGALANLVRNNTAAELVFVKRRGVCVLSAALSHVCPKVINTTLKFDRNQLRSYDIFYLREEFRKNM
eukprot:GHVR01066868.1.p1 GENE.GHVR01066868.1~~GHVR01066868.1.p1  ORF type:complete len:224 (-),score=31.41 GHVR01066868.1:406-1077(-)